jgi:two-component system nitrogen regulation sensor histidine kinase NtrY
MAQAAAGQIPLLLPDRSYRVGAVAKLTGTANARYLYVARPVSPRVVGQLRRTEAGFHEYEQFRQRRSGFKLVHGLLYLMISLTSLLAAIWVGIWFAGRFVAPITRLIGAAQEVSRGNLGIVLPVIRGEGDLRRLSQTFNTMTAELKGQRDALVSANELLTERRAFIEAVLSGVSAGVLGIDGAGRITIANNSAQALLAVPESDLQGRHLSEVSPEFSTLFDSFVADERRNRSPDQMTLQVNGEERTFAVKITRRRAIGDEGMDKGSVITFDDITELVVAQRTSAWADVARRIAHEIKNPLTPIQLSAERLKRKYSNSISTDRETFDKLTDTIVRQVGDIKTMVDEFAAFARMPQPEMTDHDLRDAVQEPVLLFRESEPNIEIRLGLPKSAVRASFDRRLLTQALTNLVKNAVEAINTYAESPDAEPGFKGIVEARLTTEGDEAVIEVIDNGTGLPKSNRNRLLEPYVTTKGHKGTGLGLAMVHKIMEQHGGSLTLDDAPPAPGRSHGALIRLRLPAKTNSEASTRASASPVLG